MAQPNRYELLESCPLAEETLRIRHATAFATAFVAPAKRERWLELLTQRPRRLSRHSHKLHSDLDRRTCRCVGETVPDGLRGEGVFDPFTDAPRIVPVNLALELAGAGDAILSLVPGELALYFFHEGEVWLCRKDG